MSTDQTQTDKQEAYRHPPSFQTIEGVIHFTGVSKEYLKEIQDVPVQEGDVIMDTYPKSGTTWAAEIVRQIFHDGAIDMTPLHEIVPYLEWEKPYRKMKQNKDISLNEFYLKKPFPRVFKIHLPYHQAPMGDGVTKPKYIYVVRNPKDTAVSFYWHYKGFLIYEFDGTWDEFFEMFITNNVNYGSWFDHVLGWWAHRDDPNILFLKYEDMKKNLSGAVKQIATFLDKDLSPEVIERIAEQTTFGAMSDGKGRFFDCATLLEWRDTAIKFVRKGEVGDWRNYFTEDQNKRFDALYI